MEVNELKRIKDTIQIIYEKKKLPRFKEITLDGQISEGLDQWFYNPPHYSATVPCLQQNIEDLVKVKGLNNREELFRTYTDFGKELFNNSKLNLDSISQLLKEKLEEFETAYYLKTKPIMKFLTNDEIVKEIYAKYPTNYDALASMLCYMNLLDFEKQLKEMEEVYVLYTSPKIGMKINKGCFTYPHPCELTADRYIPEDSKYLLRVISAGKKIVLRYNDIEYKLRAIRNILKREIFDYTSTKVNAISSDTIFKEVFKEELNGYLNRSTQELNKPTSDKIEEWIRQVAKNTSANKNSKIKSPKTIEVYLKYMVEHPLVGVRNIQENLDEAEDIPDLDKNLFPKLSYGTLRGWEKSFFKILEDRCYNKYAQKFKRFKPSQ